MTDEWREAAMMEDFRMELGGVMFDDWSLKDKRTSNDSLNWGKTLTEEEFFWYYERDIETLRQKLIDDIKELQNSFYNELQRIPIGNCIDIINKRFGVD